MMLALADVSWTQAHPFAPILQPDHRIAHRTQAGNRCVRFVEQRAGEADGAPDEGGAGPRSRGLHRTA